MMKKSTQCQKIIAVILISCLLPQLTGCYSMRPISSSEILPGDKNVIHYKKYTYKVDSVVISDGKLSGILDLSEKLYSVKNTNNIYLAIDTVMKFDNKSVSVPLDNIVTITHAVPDPKKTRLLVTSLIIGGIGIGLIVGTAIAINKTAKQTEETIEGIADALEYMCTNW